MMSTTRPYEPYLRSPEPYRFPDSFAPPPPPVLRQRLWVHIVLFLLTVASTILVGGWVFSAGLLSILLAHEFGHYFTARRYHVPASLPYFIPFPFSLFGTLGAVIRMSPRIPHRRALFDIAAAGPLAGLVLAIPLTYVGILLSTTVRTEALPPHILTLGEPLLFRSLGWLAHGSLGENTDLMLHPLAFAGWVGMFVTALNLLPIGQLDGGHISHALFGSQSRLVAQAVFGGLALFSLIQWKFTWVPLLILLFFFGIQHPRLTDDGQPIGRNRQVLGVVLGLIFTGCFSLVPFQF
ncbi:MAG: site-2 protease family protein [Acidobacteria bacterium]|nr:site-2 protease family protein [Acidobacteriota bacterium]